MKFNQVRDHIVRCYRAGLRQTIFLSGPPGIGKTACADASASILRSEFPNFSVLAWPMTVIDPLDLGGMPAMLQYEGQAPFAARLPFKDMVPQEGNGILVLDDLPTAPPLTQASAYRLVWERAIGTMRLSDGYLIIATGNRDQDRAATQRMPTPLISKMGWIEFEPDLDGWIIEMSTRDAAPVVLAFIKSRPELFVKFDPNIPGPYATARTWEAVSDLVTAYGGDLPPFEAIKGWVGEGPATEFQSYATMASQLVSPDVILMTPDTAAVPEDPGPLYAVTSALASRATPGNFRQVTTYLYRIPEEFRIYCVKSALAIQGGRMAKMSPEDRRKYKQLETTNAFAEFAIKHKELLN